FEGVGCQGSGGNILVKPFLGNLPEKQKLIKVSEEANPGYYSVNFTNGIKTRFAVYKKSGIHQYQFPKGNKGLLIDLSHVLANRFYAAEHSVKGNAVSGFVQAGTTCNAGKYKVYFHLEFNQPVRWEISGKHQLLARFNQDIQEIEMRIAFSSVNTEYAENDIKNEAFDAIK